MENPSLCAHVDARTHTHAFIHLTAGLVREIIIRIM